MFGKYFVVSEPIIDMLKFFTTGGRT